MLYYVADMIHLLIQLNRLVGNILLRNSTVTASISTIIALSQLHSES